ncbi:MAG TPA: GNAT family N-acetyltransferase [Streptomyces sp.]|uniref:GNAT family N-acetyltransferase n=1 Tax=Streptomyces sp. TaxID=1931 RepID=UPI002CB841DD|nr:GNAT family N-acetyltransferase [Streptomyces sp.]HWU09178.1 GNAT family N-acetyltransferase [Streptomyces sp.]
MPEIADDEPLLAREPARFRRSGLAWVAVDAADVPAAYLIAERVDRNLHAAQVSAHPDQAGRAVGRLLLNHVADHAAAHGVPALTLTTFVDVPWNAPYSRCCGSHSLGDSELGPALREIRQQEAAPGLERWPRICMRRDL